MKIQPGSKKIKKSISPRANSQKNSSERERSKGDSPIRTRNDEVRRKRSDSVPGEIDSLKKIRKLVKADDSEDIFVENWIQCDDCGKWRKIVEEGLWKKLQGKPKLVCKSIPGLACKSVEENWKQTYVTISEKLKNSS